MGLKKVNEDLEDSQHLFRVLYFERPENLAGWTKVIPEFRAYYGYYAN